MAIRGPKPKFTKAQIAAMQRSRDEGATLQAVADQFDCSVSYIYTHTVNHRKQTLTDRQAKHRRLTDSDIERIRQGWRDRLTTDEIADMMQVSKSVVSKYVAEIDDSDRLPAPPKLPRTTAEQNRRLAALENETIEADRRRDNATQRTPMATTGTVSKPLDWTTIADGFDDKDYDTTGPNPDHGLSLRAQEILDQWTAAISRGRIFDPTPIAVTQATYIYTASLRAWDYSYFLQYRNVWTAVRALSGVNSTDLAARVGISPASISRYESGDRNPDRHMLHRIHDSYTQLLEDALVASEQVLTLRSWADTGEETTITREGYAEYVTHDTSVSIQDFSISHIDHLATVRKMLPYPTWREPTPQNLWLTGYPNQPTLASV